MFYLASNSYWNRRAVVFMKPTIGKNFLAYFFPPCVCVCVCVRKVPMNHGKKAKVWVPEKTSSNFFLLIDLNGTKKFTKLFSDIPITVHGCNFKVPSYLFEIWHRK